MATTINTDSTSMCHALTVVCTLIHLILRITPTQALLLSLIYMWRRGYGEVNSMATSKVVQLVSAKSGTRTPEFSQSAPGSQLQSALRAIMIN